MIAFPSVRPACAVLLLAFGAVMLSGCIEQTVRIDPAVGAHAPTAPVATTPVATTPPITTTTIISSAVTAVNAKSATGPVGGPPRLRPSFGGITQVVMINTRPHDAQKVFTQTGHLPVSVDVDAVRHGPGGLERCELIVRNPLVWWQRFPCDIAADLLPIRYISLTTATIAYQPVPTCDEAALTSEATIHGFAHDPAR